MIIKTYKVEHNIFLHLSNSIPNPAYKSRNFTFTLVTTNEKGSSFDTNYHLDLEIQLYAYDYPPKRIILNNIGLCAIKFKLQKFKESYIFKSVSLSEISSRFRNGAFFFVVVCKNNECVKPLVIEDFKVKAKEIKKNQKFGKKGK